MKQNGNVSMSNIYRLDGRVPIGRAIPFGLQHVLAMFVANLTPITIIGAAAGLENGQIAVLLQNAMFVAGIATLIQLYPVWKIGSKLPIVMGGQFHLCNDFKLCGNDLRVRDHDRCCSCGRSCGRNTGTSCKVLEEDHYTGCRGFRGNCNRLFFIYSGSKVFWRRIY